MARYINADVFEVFGYETQDGTFDDGVQYVLNKIDAQPTADVKPVVRGENLGGGAFLCSVCGFDDVAHSHTVKFCPNCGAEIINARPADEDDSGLRK